MPISGPSEPIWLHPSRSEELGKYIGSDYFLGRPKVTSICNFNTNDIVLISFDELVNIISILLSLS